MTLTDWIRSLGARWAAPRVDPPELAAVEREIEAAQDPRATRVVERALSMVGRGIYGLGKGGRHPDAPTPFDVSGRCDCSGFALAWVAYYRELVAYAWRVHVACRGEP